MNKQYDLEERTEKFAKEVIVGMQEITQNYGKYRIGQPGCTLRRFCGANYIEANESLSKKDFANRIKICRKEAKESRYWLRLVISANSEFEKEISELMQESTELMNIFGAILKKSV